ncbi:MAG TPA: hypothetical protein VJO12_01665 [Stellaceae bacterium]|nr:hypothetical protein [Stellaceae bacterium]
MSPTCLDVPAAPQHPVIGETNAALSSTARREYGCGLAATAAECREIAALPHDIIGNIGQTGISLLWPERGNMSRFTWLRHANACFTPLSVIL